MKTATRTALITGVTGQDGSYLAELLLAQGYRVVGMPRRASSPRHEHLGACLQEERFSLVDADLCDQSSLVRVLEDVRPDEIYNLAAQSHVGTSFTQPVYTFDVNALGVIRLLDAVRQVGLLADRVRVYQASTSEMFGASDPPQNELTTFRPQSPYAVAKVAAHHACALYRKAYGLHVSCGILHNHEGPRRAPAFVTRKITQAVARIALGKQERLALGNLDAQRDWGHARDYVRAMHLMLQQKEPDDYVIATGETHSVREFVAAAFEAVKIREWQHLVTVDPAFLRPADVMALKGDATKARLILGWTPTTTFRELVAEMVAADLAREGGVPVWGAIAGSTLMPSDVLALGRVG